MRDENGRFVAGASGNPGGRPRAVRPARDMIDALPPELVMELMEIVRDWSQPARARVAAATALLDRRYGRPRREAEFSSGLILPLPGDEEREEPASREEERHSGRRRKSDWGNRAAVPHDALRAVPAEAEGMTGPYASGGPASSAPHLF